MCRDRDRNVRFTCCVSVKLHLGCCILGEYAALTSASYAPLLSIVEPPTRQALWDYVTGNTVIISQFQHMLIDPVKNDENHTFSLNQPTFAVSFKL